jgi:hypothetical protein
MTLQTICNWSHRWSFDPASAARIRRLIVQTSPLRIRRPFLENIRSFIASRADTLKYEKRVATKRSYSNS